MNKEKYLFPHCEKTGGSSVITALARYQEANGVRNKENEFMWFPQWKIFLPLSAIPFTNADDLTDKLKQQIGFLLPFVYRVYFTCLKQVSHSKAIKPEDLNTTGPIILHGHFIADEIDNINPNEYNTILIVRNPLKRMISHYLHFCRVGWYQIPTFRKVFKKEEIPQSFQEFAMLPQMRNYQSQIVANLPLKSFAIRGTTNHLQHILDSMHINAKPPHVNRSPTNMNIVPPILNINEAFIERFKAYHAEDYSLYQILLQ